MTRKQAIEITGGLGHPSKMPCPSYGLPALKTCPTGKKLRKIKGTVCSKCYALKGKYPCQSVVDCQERRLKGTKDPEWVDAMVFLLKCEGNNYFRWHDSGDIYSETYFLKMLEVIRLTPTIKHWIPTKEIKLLRKYQDQLPKNACFRLASVTIGACQTMTWKTTCTVNYKKGFQCPAYKQGGNCLTCRACWSNKRSNVNYKLH